MKIFDSDILQLALYFVPLFVVMYWYLRRHRHQEATHAATLQESVQAGLTEPASLHPVIDPKRCLGSKACVSACPEKAIGIIGGKAQLVNPAHCIGHGACKAACPHDAIQLVFGSARRGVDIPQVNPDFQTNVPGIFIAGELGGMGLIRKAVEQGRQAMESIAKLKRGEETFDVVIVGAGPAGISASLGAMEKKLRFVTVEQEAAFGGTVYHYPRNKVVMTAPVVLPMIGKMKFGEVSKEKLLEFWQGVVEKTGLRINFNERMETIRPQGNGFVVKTSKQEYRTRAVLLAIGRRGTPRKLDVPGEEQPKVVYRLIDAEQYRQRHVLVVGGGDSALEAALAIAGEPGTNVVLSYRSEAFGRVKEKNRQRLAEAEKAGRVKVLLKSNVKQIDRDKVTLDQEGKKIELRNDAVIVSAGGILPTPFLKEIGILVETKYGTA
ncbi:MAG: NAD(P)-binding domain-containing protein [Gammaproteobacteria bacterium]|nr:NAD(P)-binding domain-containing protein [Gammaproteobacteria bacterium]